MMKEYKLKNGGQICIDFENSNVKSMLFGGEEMICGNAPLFYVKLRDASGAHRILSARNLYIP